MLALGLEGGRVMLVDEATGEVKWDVQAHPAESAARAAMSPDGSLVASVGNADPHWKLWDVASGALHRVGAAHDGTGTCICGVPDLGHPLVVQEGCPVVAHGAGMGAVVFSPCGPRLATGGLDYTVILWDAQTGEAAHRMSGHGDRVVSVSFSADGARLASGSFDASVRVWGVTTGTLLRTIPDAHEIFVNCVHFSPTNNRRIATSGYTQCSLWDVDTDHRIRTVGGRFFSVFSPDGRTIATTNSAHHVLLVNAETGELVSSMVGHQRLVVSASFSVDDGSKLASGSVDGTCKVWDLSTGALLRTIEVGTGVWSASWGRDWVRDTQRGVAFAMGHHPRLGAASQVSELEPGLLQMILDRV